MRSDLILPSVTVKNSGLPPERADLKISDLPKGWTASFVGQGKPVEAVFVAPNDDVSPPSRVPSSWHPVRRSTYSILPGQPAVHCH